MLHFQFNLKNGCSKLCNMYIQLIENDFSSLQPDSSNKCRPDFLHVFASIFTIYLILWNWKVIMPIFILHQVLIRFSLGLWTYSQSESTWWWNSNINVNLNLSGERVIKLNCTYSFQCLNKSEIHRVVKGSQTHFQ